MSHRHDEDEAKGTGKQVKGKIKEAAGVLTETNGGKQKAKWKKLRVKPRKRSAT
jgi:uncharacterized protein YjbJ (UPF0337 family)